jgi:hypothetical protein
MTRLPGFLLGTLLALGFALVPAIALAAADGGSTTLEFGGERYVHRWSKDHQHEFTPVAQPDLQRWTDRLTVNVHLAARDGEGLATVANTVLSNYQRHGRIIRTASVPRASQREAEHLIVAALGTPAFIELVLARAMLRDGVAMVLVYSHRIHGEKVGDAAAAWLRDHGPAVETWLMGFEGLPSVAELGRLSR